MANDLMQMSDVSTMALAVAKSGMFPGITNQEQAFALMMIVQADGIHPMKALARYHIIEGRPSWKAGALLAAFKERGGHYTFTKRTNTEVEGVFEKDGEKQVVSWTYAMAEAAGLVGKKNWKYPRQMLTARVISEGVNLLDPGISGGFYTTEEIMDLDPDELGGTAKQKKGRETNDDRVLEIETLIEAAETQEAADKIIRESHSLIIAALPEKHKKRLKERYFEKLATFQTPGTPAPAVVEEIKADIATQETPPVLEDPHKTKETTVGPVNQGSALAAETLKKRLAEDAAKNAETANRFRTDAVITPSESDPDFNVVETSDEKPAPLHRRPLDASKTPEPTPEPPKEQEAPRKAKKPDPPKVYGSDDNYPDWIKIGAKCDYTLKPGGSSVLVSCIITKGPYNYNGQLVVEVGNCMSPLPIACIVEVK